MDAQSDGDGVAGKTAEGEGGDEGALQRILRAPAAKDECAEGHGGREGWLVGRRRG